MPKHYARFKAKPEKAAAMPMAMREEMSEHAPMAMAKAKMRKKKGKKAAKSKARAASRMK